MALGVRISEPALLEELVAELIRNGCVAHADGTDSCRVVHVHARDAHEACLELSFFLRAWRSAHPSVAASLTT